MAQWTAQVFVDSNVGEITANVQASTYPGAKQQIERLYGPVQSIFSLRQVSNGNGNGGGSSSGGNPFLALVGLAGLLIVGGAIAGSDGGGDYTPSESTEYAPVERVQAAPDSVAPVAPKAAPQSRDYASPAPSYCVTENFEPC